MRLLGSVLSYLAQVHHIPFFTHEEFQANKFYQYIVEDAYYNFCAKQIGELDSMDHRAFVVERYLKNPAHLAEFQQVFDRFRAVGTHDHQLHEAASAALQLYTRHGSRSILDSIHFDILPEEEERDPSSADPRPLKPDQYFAFVWRKFDDIGRCLVDWIENDLGDMPGMVPPINCQLFDKPQSSITLNLDFEKDFFDMYLKVIIYLNTIE
ncbi:hypothetical protein GCM10011511_15150 [Puia dinghuensis]|uniref:Uncharacterized protein n=2 Tax=Puia dinghuensis TaxID=1792502 RepID=A0A8J2UBB1_9BACT|nr:hypothetical protein GCM10011511_15150 [Puia dinghuensis]